MLCSLCLRNQQKFIKLGCNHIICLNCLPRKIPLQSNFKYQCSTCFQSTQINLIQDVYTQMFNVNDKHFYPEYSQQLKNKQNQDSLFCWSCVQNISIQQFIKGRHQNHDVQTYDQAMPVIKNKMLNQLQKSLTLVEFLKQKKQNFLNYSIKQNFQNLTRTVHIFFQKQHDIIDLKRQQILNEIQNHYIKTFTEIQKQLCLIEPSLTQIEQISIKIQDFVTQKIGLNQLGSINDLSNIIDQSMKSLKKKKLQIPQMPIFIEKSSVKDSIQQSCCIFLNKYIKLENIQSSQVFSQNQEYKNNLSTSKLSRVIVDKQYLQYDKQNQDYTSNVYKKVRLVDKVKGKMNITMFSTSYK